ncbi:MAG: arginine N-succinyltransferase [Desulfobacterales bacterium]|nr:arginine N-succinyltransferase [Desulfobacterales bacterium]
MEKNNESTAPETAKKRFGLLQVLGLMFIAAVVAMGITAFVLKTYLFPTEFKPVTLKPHEEQILAAKLERIDSIEAAAHLKRDKRITKPSRVEQFDPKAPLKPEPYSEKGLKREIGFTERELNALLSKNTDLAKKLAIDLSDDLISAKLLVPVDEDFPVMGGKILRVRAGVVFTSAKGKPVVMLKGITVMGVPIPNAWLGGIKNIDLVKEFGADKGFWKTFSAGVENIEVEEGHFKIKLKE